jgi:ketosteroid isomerase-like protein
MAGDEEAVLFANDRFYMAFSTRDMDAMEDLWSRGPVLCVHPGWQPLHGREDVLASWRGILGEGRAPDVTCHIPRATVLGDSAIVVCIEDVGGAYLCATNVFVREDGEWRMSHHHAGPVNMNPEDLLDEPDVAMN